MESNLQALLNGIKATEEIMKKDLMDVEYQFRPSLEMQKRQAVTKLEELKTQYFNEISGKSTYFFITGTRAKADKFCEISQNYASAFWYNVNDLIEKFLEASGLNLIKDPVAGPAVLVDIVKVLRPMMEQFGLYSQSFDVSAKFFLPLTTTEDKINLVRKFIDYNSQGKLWALLAQKAAREHALSKGFTGNILPVVISGLTEEESQQTAKNLTSHYFVNIGNKTVDKPLVFATFKQIKDALNLTETNNSQE